MAIERLRRRTDRQTTGGLGNITRVFAHRNYLVYVSGNSISLIGWWLERVAVGWLTWTLTHSGAWLGLISLADFLPVLFLAPFAGVLADRRDRVWTIRLTQWVGCVQASLLAILVVTDAMTIEILFALVLMLGFASGVAQPSRLALIPTLVDRESLASALAINSVIFNLTRFIGPALAGIVIAEIGIAAAFAANAVSYIAFQISLLNLRGLPPQPAVGRQNVLRASVEAFSYVCRHSGIGPMLLLFAVTTIGTRGFIELFPGFADRVFGRGPQGLAMLTSTVGLGAICGASWMVLRSAITGLANVVLVCTLIMSLAILAFTATDAFYLALPCVFVAGAMMTITGTGAQTLIQAAVDARMSGRVMALYGMIFRAGPAVGAALMGTLSEYFGLRLALAVGAMVSGSFWLATRFRHKSMATGLECSPIGARETPRHMSGRNGAGGSSRSTSSITTVSPVRIALPAALSPVLFLFRFGTRSSSARPGRRNRAYRPALMRRTFGAGHAPAIVTLQGGDGSPARGKSEPAPGAQRLERGRERSERDAPKRRRIIRIKTGSIGPAHGAGSP